MHIQIMKLRASETLPACQTELSTGIDTAANLEQPLTLRPGERPLALPPGYEAQVGARSSSFSHTGSR